MCIPKKRVGGKHVGVEGCSRLAPFVHIADTRRASSLFVLLLLLLLKERRVNYGCGSTWASTRLHGPRRRSSAAIFVGRRSPRPSRGVHPLPLPVACLQ